MTAEEKLIRAIGDVKDSYVRLATAYERPSIIKAQGGEFREVTGERLPEPEHPWLRPVLTGGALAAVLALVVALGFMWGLNGKEPDITPYEPPVSVTETTGVTTDTPPVTEPDQFPQELHDYVIRSENFGDSISGEAYLRIVFGDYYDNNGVISVVPETGRVEVVGAKTDKVWSTARFVTRDTPTGEITLDRDIVIKIADYDLPMLGAIICVPIEGEDSYCTTIYQTDDYREYIDYEPNWFYTIKSPDEIRFEEDVFGFVVHGNEHIGMGFRARKYDDNTPYEWLYRGEPYKEGMHLRFDSFISNPDRKLLEHYDPDVEPFAFAPEYVCWEIEEIYYDRTSEGVFAFDNSWIRLKNSDEASAAFSEFRTENDYNRFSADGSFNIISQVLDDGKLLIYAGLPGNGVFTVSVFVYDGETLRQFPDLFLHLTDTLESIECDGVNRLKYYDYLAGDCDIMLDFNTLTYRAWLENENETALALLAEYAGTDDYALPLDPESTNLIYNGEAFVQGNRSYYTGDIYSVTDGTVQTVDWIPGQNMYIDILDGNGNLWTYANCGSIANVYEGMEVKAGDKISSNWAGGVQIRFNSPVEPPELTEPAVDYDMTGVELEGTPFDSGELNELSVDSYIERFIGWETEWSEKSGQENRIVNTGLFIDSLGVPGLKELYYRAFALDYILATDNIPDLDCYKNSGAVVKKPHPLEPDYIRPFASTGISYESFRNAYLESFTEDMALSLLNNFDFFLKYGDEVYIVEVTRGGDLGRVHEEYELVKQTDDEIVFRKTQFRVEVGASDLTYHPELRDTYERTYTTFKFVKEDGAWKVAYAPEYYW